MVMQVSRQAKLGMGILVALILAIAVGGMASGEKKAWELIRWDEPVPMVERISGDRYILPQGWKEATKGVNKFVLANGGGMDWDIATMMNLRRFEQLTGIKTEYIEVPVPVAYAKTLSFLVTRGTEVHVILVGNATNDASSYVGGDWLVPLDILYPPEVEALYSPTLKDIKINGHYYVHPVATVPVASYYRPSWLENAGVDVPTSLEELYEAANKCRTWSKQNLGDDYYGAVYLTELGGFSNVYHPLVFSQKGGVVYDGKYRFTSPEFKNAFAYLVNLVTDDIAPKAVLSYGYADTPQMFGLGKAAFLYGSATAFVTQFSTEFPEILGDWDILPPLRWSTETPQQYAASAVGGNMGAISKYISDKDKAAAMLFLDFLRSKEATRHELVVEGNEVFYLGLYEEANIGAKVDWNLADSVADELGIGRPHRIENVAKRDIRRRIMGGARLPVYPPGFPRIAEEVVTQFHRAVLQELSIEEALQKIQDVADMVSG